MYLSKRALTVLALIILGTVALAWQSRKPDDTTGSNDIPVVIRTNGGMLEISTIKHRRSFDLTKVGKVLGYEIPFCKETATYVVDAAITYRVRLAKRWVGDYTDGKLHLSVPPPEPSLPVAFDTSRLRASLDKCWFAPSRGAQNELLRSISGKLAADARGPQYMKIARGDEGRATIREFAQKWILGHKRYDLPRSTRIKITYWDE